MLVGINGSGKTSILNIINWLLVPDLSNLCTIQFNQITLWFNLDGRNRKIICKQTKNVVKLTIDKFYPLTISLDKATSEIKGPIAKEAMIWHYKGLSPNDREKRTWETLTNIPNPVNIKVERSEKDDDTEKRVIRTANGQRKLKTGNTPIEMIRKIVSKTLSKYGNDVIELNKQLRDSIMISVFDSGLIKPNLSFTTYKPLSISKVDTLETSVKKFVKTHFARGNTFNTLAKISKYFNNVKKIIGLTNNYETNTVSKLKIAVNSHEFKKIKDLLKVFEKFEKKAQYAYRKIGLLIDTVNKFYIDSSKKLYFNKETNEFYYCILNKNGKIINDGIDIANLSSGEQQILIIFTIIALNNSNKNIFLIDEPELSLHPRWQSNLLPSLIKVMPKETQLFLATHSPEIVGRLKSKSIILLPYNK